MLTLARVVEIHPEQHSVDLEVLDDGRRLSGVQVLSRSAGGDFGVADLTVPDKTGYDAGPSRTRDVYAVVAAIREHPVVIGFLFPQIAQCLFAERGRVVSRHGSDVYTTIDAHGNAEFYHPSGTYLRIGTTADHEDLTGQDYDGIWKIGRNTDKAVSVRLRVANAGVEVATLTIDPSGNLTASVDGTVVVTAGGEMTINAPKVTINAPVQINGQLNTSGDTIAGSVSLKTHTHSNVSTGSSNSGPPN